MNVCNRKDEVLYYGVIEHIADIGYVVFYDARKTNK